MKNLIEEIEKSKSYYETDISCEFNDGWNNALDKAIKILNRHSLITAPKSIKLSEILGNLKLQIEEPENLIKIQFNRKINAIGFGEYDEDWRQNTWQTIVSFYKDLTIKNICIKLQDNFKWLYTLWIAGTEIVNDLE